MVGENFENFEERKIKMRIRFKPWARGELEASSFYIDNPEEYKGKWRDLFGNDKPLYLELGCGKGGFISQIASENQNINFVAIDMVDAMLGLAKRNIESVYAEKSLEVKNVYLTRFDMSLNSGSSQPLSSSKRTDSYVQTIAPACLILCIAALLSSSLLDDVQSTGMNTL